MIICNDNERVGMWIAEKSDGGYRDGSICIGVEKNKKLVAGIMYEWFNGTSVYVHVAAEKNWFDREFLLYCFHYPFIEMDCNVMIGLVPEANLKARKLDEHLGFTLKHIIPEAHPQGGLCIYTMYKHECKWLRIKNVIA